MKRQIRNYIFNPGAKQIQILDFPTLQLENLLLITNVTANIIIYNFASPAKGAIVNSNTDNFITLDFDTAGMAATDRLQILYDDPAYDDENKTEEVLESLSRDGELSVRVSDDTLWGDAGPLQQHEKETPGQPIRELMTFDSNMHMILGSQNLTNNGRIKVEDLPVPEQIVQAILARGNDEAVINLTGQGSVVLQLTGTWAGTMTFTVSNDRQTWYAIYGQIPGTAIGQVLTTTANGIFRFGTAGFLFLRVQFTSYTSGVCKSIMVASPLISVPTQVFLTGSQTQQLQQKGSTFELLTNDTSLPTSLNPNIGAIKDALQNPDPWNPRGNYFIGDTINYQGQVYQCILNHSAATAGNIPTNGTYWQLDQRQSKTLVTTTPVSAPAASRVRVEIDLDLYQYQLAEKQLIEAMTKRQNDFLFQDYELSLLQSVGGGEGKKYALGQSAGSFYNFEELR